MLFRRPKTPALQSGDVVDVAGCRVRLRVHARSARISLKIDARERLVVATAPTLRRLGDAVVFAESRADWMAARAATESASTWVWSASFRRLKSSINWSLADCVSKVASA